MIFSNVAVVLAIIAFILALISVSAVIAMHVLLYRHKRS